MDFGLAWILVALLSTMVGCGYFEVADPLSDMIDLKKHADQDHQVQKESREDEGRAKQTKESVQDAKVNVKKFVSSKSSFREIK